MERQRIYKILAVSAAALALQGCIAAAFPIAAGGLLASNGRAGDSLQSQAEPASDDADRIAVAAPEPLPTPAPAPAEKSASDTGTIAVTMQPESAGPTTANASVETSLPADGQAEPAAVTLFDPLYSYVSSDDVSKADERTSAILTNANSLQADREKCAGGTPTVLIDLDPKEGDLFPIDTGTASPALADRLTQMRAQGFAVAWISNSPAERESILRAALLRSGLDQLGADRLLLISEPDQRKQVLREQLAESSCLVAIAGDERSDFHELFGYLLNPSDAFALEPIIGEGWFLIPTPLLPERSQ